MSSCQVNAHTAHQTPSPGKGMAIKAQMPQRSDVSVCEFVFVVNVVETNRRTLPCKSTQISRNFLPSFRSSFLPSSLPFLPLPSCLAAFVAFAACASNQYRRLPVSAELCGVSV